MKKQKLMFKSLDEFNKYFFPEKYNLEKLSRGKVELNVNFSPKLIAKVTKYFN